MVLILCGRNHRKHISHSQVPETQLCGGQYLSLNTCRRTGKIWQTIPSSWISPMPYTQAWRTWKSGIERLMKQMPTLSALVKFSCTTQHISAHGLAVLDPNVKLAYAEEKWGTEQLKDGINCLESVVRLFLTPNSCHFLIQITV